MNLRSLPAAQVGLARETLMAPEGAFCPADRLTLTREVAAYLRTRPGRGAVAVHDRLAGTRFAVEPDPGMFRLASVAKVGILLGTLLNAQSARRELTPAERVHAEAMMRRSDNAAAQDLAVELGGDAGLTRLLRGLGVDQTWPAPAWGTTRSCPADQLRLLDLLTSPTGPVTPGHRAYAHTLMTSVEPSQAWGVSAAARPGEQVALKNGWMPVDDHDGRWAINSVGRLSSGTSDLLIAVLTEHNPDKETGIRTTEDLAALVISAIRR
ncbi:serine hydrolase [Herbidospora cretacea]|uniref:serine hydrolase n=1 Tax=Herbidospora cretacea TaxID=28444 RepID=UPI0012DF0FDA|nr:serine hydrolase [Herbidospora cretacea]